MPKSKSTTDSSTKKKSKKHKTKKKKDRIAKKTLDEKNYFKSDLYEIKGNNPTVKKQINLATCMKCIDSSYRSKDSTSKENEPKKLCCICQKTKKTRFTITCDTCSEWFHGSCVGISVKNGKEIKQGNLLKAIVYKTVRK